jgi:hypothetical protein
MPNVDWDVKRPKAQRQRTRAAQRPGSDKLPDEEEKRVGRQMAPGLGAHREARQLPENFERTGGDGNMRHERESDEQSLPLKQKRQIGAQQKRPFEEMQRGSTTPGAAVGYNPPIRPSEKMPPKLARQRSKGPGGRSKQPREALQAADGWFPGSYRESKI